MTRLALAAFAAALPFAAPASAQTASFDCAKAETAVEKTICGSTLLSALDGELGRLYRLGIEGANAATSGASLKSSQEAFLEQRNGCATAADAVACLSEAYVRRIAAVRTDFADARSNDSAGITIGPKALSCPTVGVNMNVTFVNSDPGFAYAAWPDHAYVLPQTVSADGGRYELDLNGKTLLIWVKGNHAMVDFPDGTNDPSCVFAD